MTAAVVALLSIPIRAKTVGFWLWPTLRDWTGDLPVALMTACYDVLFVAGTAAVAALLLLPVFRRWIKPTVVYSAHLVFSVVTLLDGLSNISVVPWLGQPFNFQWLYYSDFLRGSDALASILATVPAWQMAASATGAGLLVWGVIALGRWVDRRLHSPRRHVAFFVALVLGCVLYLGAAFRWRMRTDWSDDVLVNPVWAFAASCVRAMNTPALLSLETPHGPSSFAPPPASTATSLLPGDHPVPRDVIIVVLESLGTSYVGLYGAGHGATPVLDAQRDRAAVFTRAYAHAPATNFTLVSLLTGLHPRVGFRPTTAVHPAIALPRLPARLRQQHGMATGFFSSASLEFQRAGEFLAADGGFDHVEDHTGRPEAAARTRAQWRDFIGTDDHSTVESMIRWIESRGKQPVFSVLWTAQTHFPYYATGEKSSRDFDRYLAALAETDRALGRLLGWLDASGRADGTLVVVLGDHGQAFGQHNTFGHAGHTYEEHLRIPLLLINRPLFSGEHFDALCGPADIVPTLCEILDLPAEDGWHGRSLFRTDRPEELFFFAAWSDFHIGLVQGDMKIVYNVTKDTFSVYDLIADPQERRNLAAGRSELTTDARLRLAGWAQYVESAYAGR